MDRVPQTTADDLPNEVLTLILKCAADLPTPSPDKGLPFPVVATRVSHRWRAVTLAYPQLWTTIRISHYPRSWTWAKVFLRRSGDDPLDISINLEWYAYNYLQVHHQQPYYGEAVEIHASSVLDVVGPHIGRWRSLAFCGWKKQIKGFLSFVGGAPGAASRLESAHFSLLDPRDNDTITPIIVNLDGQSFHSLRLNVSLDLGLGLFPSFRALHTLDVPFSTSRGHSQEFRQMFGPSSTLTTFVLRNVYPKTSSALLPIDASTIRSFAVSFSAPFYSLDPYSSTGICDGFDSLTSIFSLPNLEYLEIVAGFSGSRAEDLIIEVPDEWEAPLFPHLRSLRLESTGFGRKGLALMQSFSHTISDLQLIYTTRNQNLLVSSVGAPWPALRSLTVEAPQIGVTDLSWLASFVTMRASHDAVRRTAGCAIEQPLQVRWLHSTPSPALIDGSATNKPFYIDDFDGRAVDFAHVPNPLRSCDCWDGCEVYQELDTEQTGAAIDEEF
ncbi:hypothetical protein C8R43DRAFT_1111104 [Mycena crocata]|nr:hypothetical protein C8R43DRAFT_1111104 [Mycena crocata]